MNVQKPTHTRRSPALAVSVCVACMCVGAWGSAFAFHARMELRPEVVRIGEVAELRVVVDGVERAMPPNMPVIDGLRISGPAMEQSFQTTIVNGRTEQTRTVSFRYTIMPLRPGDYTIGPMAYTYDGQTVQLPAQRLQVADAGTGRDGHQHTISDLVFARLEVSAERVYVNQSFTLDISIYSREVNLGRDISLSGMPESGIQTQPFQELRGTRQLIRDDVYEVRRYRTQVRPVSAGTIRFAPALSAQLLVPRQRGQRRGIFDDPFFRGMFADHEAHPVTLNVDPVEVVVRPLPQEGRPESFTGGVGTFMFQVRLHPAKAQPGDPITLMMQLEGEGNMDAVGAPALEDSEWFRVYTPRLASSEVDRSGFRGRKTYEQVIIPRTADAVEVPPLRFAYFDPQAERYRVVEQGPFALELEIGDDIVAPRTVRGDADTTAAAARIVGRDIAYLKSVPESWHEAYPASGYRRTWFGWLQILPPLALAVLWGFARRRRALEANVALARRYRAPSHARQGLRQAEQARRAQDEEHFFEGVWTGLTGYFGHRLNLASGAVTSDQVLAAMRTAGLAEADHARLRNLFESCERRRFARITVTPEQMEGLLDDFRCVLKASERIKT